MSAEPRNLVFLSYSHKDKRWLDDLLTHLKPYLREGLITAWSDRHIKPGSKWMAEIQIALKKTKVAVLLVTHHFLASDFIHDHELTPLLADAEAGGAAILWIPVRACSYEVSPIQKYQAAIDPAKPINRMKSERDSAWVQICRSILEALRSPIDASQADTRLRNEQASTLPIRVWHSEVVPALHRPLLRDLEQSMAAGKLQGSSLAPIVHAALSRRDSVRLTQPFDSSWIINGIRLSDEYFGLVNASAGERDWQRDYVAVATPTLVGLARSLQRSAAAQSLLKRLCDLLADQLHLRLKWPSDDDLFNDLVNKIYSACLRSSDLESDDVYTLLKQLPIVGPLE